MLGRILMLGLVGVLAVPGLVAAQSQRSMMRTLGGVGLMAGGVVIAFWEQDCRVAGSLSEDPAVSIEFANRVGSVGILFDDARNPVSSKMSGRCDLDWTVNTYVGLELFGRLANLESTGARQANALRGEFPKVDDTRGEIGQSRGILAHWPAVRGDWHGCGWSAPRHCLGRRAGRLTQSGAGRRSALQDLRILSRGSPPGTVSAALPIVWE